MLDVIHIKKNMDGKEVLKKCDFTVPSNTVFGIVGANGAGKSTLLRIISGVMKADDGTVLIDNETIFDNEFAKRNVLFVSDDVFYEFNQTINSIMLFYDSFYNIDMTYFSYLLERFELKKYDIISRLSKGKKKRVFIALALAIAPKVLLLDETFDGLDPKAKLIFKEELKAVVAKKPMSVLLTSHSLRELVDFIDNYGYLRNGELITLTDEVYYNDPIYRILSLNRQIVIPENINVVKKVIADNYLIIDVHNSLEEINNSFTSDDVYNAQIVPFDDWIVYQMEDLV